MIWFLAVSFPSPSRSRGFIMVLLSRNSMMVSKNLVQQIVFAKCSQRFSSRWASHLFFPLQCDETTHLHTKFFKGEDIYEILTMWTQTSPLFCCLHLHIIIITQISRTFSHARSFFQHFYTALPKNQENEIARAPRRIFSWIMVPTRSIEYCNKKKTWQFYGLGVRGHKSVKKEKRLQVDLMWFS